MEEHVSTVSAQNQETGNELHALLELLPRDVAFSVPTIQRGVDFLSGKKTRNIKLTTSS